MVANRLGVMTTDDTWERALVRRLDNCQCNAVSPVRCKPSSHSRLTLGCCVLAGGSDGFLDHVQRLCEWR